MVITPTTIDMAKGIQSALLGIDPAIAKAALSVIRDNNKAIPPSSGSISPRKTIGKETINKLLAIIFLVLEISLELIQAPICDYVLAIAGMIAPEKTCQARIDFATKLRVM